MNTLLLTLYMAIVTSIMPTTNEHRCVYNINVYVGDSLVKESKIFAEPKWASKGDTVYVSDQILDWDVKY